MLRIFITSGILLAVINSYSNGQLFPESQFLGYPNDAPSNPSTYSELTSRRPESPKLSGYPKEAPSNPLEYPAKIGYPKEAPSNPLEYPVKPTLRPNTPRPTTPRPTTPRPTTPRPTTPRYIAPRPTTAKLSGYEYKAPSNPLVIISPVETTPRPTTPRPTTPRYIAPRPTTAKLSGYEYKAPSNPLVIVSPVEKAQGYPRIVPENRLVYNSISENLIGSSSIQQLYVSPVGEGSKLLAKAASLPKSEDGEDGSYRADDDHTHWDIRKSIPGEPGSDYPVLDEIPVTTFSCDNKLQGYYADVETGCQVFHICTYDSRPQKKSFLCPNGTVFNQELLICDWWSSVDCAASETHFSRNSEVGRQPAVNKKTTTVSNKSRNQF